MELKDRIKAMREELRMSQLELANEVGCSQMAISAWEGGRRTPNYKWILEMERVAKKFKAKTKLK
jgi:DNA-binding XRE family transcriptional regulator